MPAFCPPLLTFRLALLPPKTTPLGQPRLASRRLAQHLRAPGAHDHRLRVAEDGCDGEAAGALDVHEEAARARHEGFELVLFGFGGGAGVQEIDGEDLSGNILVNDVWAARFGGSEWWWKGVVWAGEISPRAYAHHFDGV